VRHVAAILRPAASVMVVGACAVLLCVTASSQARAWGDEGHEVIGLIAEHYLEPGVRARVLEILRDDDTGLVEHDMPHESTWADKYRDSDRDGDKRRYLGTRDWHFVDLEITGLDVSRACYGRRPLAAGVPVSVGPAEDCIIDKIDQFYAELENPATPPAERRVALQFLLHLVGDLHQPLHASDDHDQGGNRKLVSAEGMELNNLHHDWDVEFVRRLGASDSDIANKLIAHITEAERARWSSGTPLDWALETYAVSKQHAYALLPAPSGGSRYELSQAYVEDATRVTAEQLSKAGVRLASMLNHALE
jgi:S1/P1 Nuclease